MKKALIIIVSVFLVLVVLGVVLYPTDNMVGTIDNTKSAFSPVFSALDFSTKTVKTFVEVVNAFDKDANTEHLDDIISENVDYYTVLNDHLPLFVEHNNLNSRCSNQGLSLYTFKVDFHDHKVCNFICYLDPQKNIFGSYSKDEMLTLWYCGICEDIVCLTGRINNSGTKYLYPYEQAGQSIGYIRTGMVVDTFLYDDILTSFYD